MIFGHQPADDLVRLMTDHRSIEAYRWLMIAVQQVHGINTALDPIERPSLPNVEAWYARLCERPAYRAHAMNPFGTNNEEWLAIERGEA